MRLIDADALMDTVGGVDWYHINKLGYLTSGANSQYHTPIYKAEDIYNAIRNTPTVDAVEVGNVAQMLCDLFEDSCPCNYGDIDEWLAGSDGCTELCDKNEDHLHCWKLFVKRYGERRSK